MRIINRILADEFKANRYNFVFIFILMIVAVGFDALAPWPFKILIDNVLSGSPSDGSLIMGLLTTLFRSRYVLGFFAVFIYFSSTFFTAILEYVKSVVIKHVIKNITSDFSKRAFKNLQSLAIGYYKEQKIGDYIYRLSYDVSALGDFLESGILPIVSALIFLGVTITIMCLISVKLTLFSLAAIPFLGIGIYSFNRYIANVTKKSETYNSAAFSFIEEALTHLRIIQAFSQESSESENFGRKTDTMLRADSVLYRLDFLLTLLVGIIVAVSYSIIMLYGMTAVFAGTLTTGLLIVFIFYLDNLTNPLLSIVYAATSIRESYTKIIRMEDFFNNKLHLENTGDRKTIRGFDIRFHSVTLADNGKKILKNVSFHIPEGKKTVILGMNGSGKTSVVNLIMRFITKPDHGKVFLGGVPLMEYDLKALRDAISYVPQEINLFNNSIRNNISFGHPDATLAEIKEAARLSTASSFIEKIKDHYDSSVGEGGMLLSGGQRQRIMLARALLKKDAKILIFDETFSALDVKTRTEVLEHLKGFSRGKTTVMISNVFEVIDGADHVIVMNKGEVIYEGTSGRLTKETSLYKMFTDAE